MIAKDLITQAGHSQTTSNCRASRAPTSAMNAFPVSGCERLTPLDPTGSGRPANEPGQEHRHLLAVAAVLGTERVEHHLLLRPNVEQVHGQDIAGG